MKICKFQPFRFWLFSWLLARRAIKLTARVSYICKGKSRNFWTKICKFRAMCDESRLVQLRILGRLYVLRTELRAFGFFYLSKHVAPSGDFFPKGQPNWLPEVALFASANLAIFGQKFANSGHSGQTILPLQLTSFKKGKQIDCQKRPCLQVQICYFWTKICKFRPLCDESRLVRLRILGRLYVLRTELRAFGFVFSSKHGASSVDFLPVHETLYQSRDWLSSVNFSLLSIVGRN